MLHRKRYIRFCGGREFSLHPVMKILEFIQLNEFLFNSFQCFLREFGVNKYSQLNIQKSNVLHLVLYNFGLVSWFFLNFEVFHGFFNTLTQNLCILFTRCARKSKITQISRQSISKTLENLSKFAKNHSPLLNSTVNEGNNHYIYFYEITNYKEIYSITEHKIISLSLTFFVDLFDLFI